MELHLQKQLMLATERSTTIPNQVFHRTARGQVANEIREKEKPTRDKKQRTNMNRQSITADGEMRSTLPKSKLVQCGYCFIGITVRVLLFVVFIQLERTPPFMRKIHPEEMWLYKNPPTDDYVPASILLPAAFVVPFLLVCLNFLIYQDRVDFVQGNSVITLALGLNGVLTSLIKITVGRPRPDFFYRCFPDGKMINDDMICDGNQRIVNEGRKSFPSGHSSFAFAGFGFVFLYLAAKLHVFSERGRGQAWRLCLIMMPLIVALLVAISRTCDYHHHWQDVVVGSMLGMLCTYISYRQYYPSIFASNSHRPYIARTLQTANCCIPVAEVDGDEQKPLIGDEKETKWI